MLLVAPFLSLPPALDVRPLGPEDLEHVRWALYAALAWTPARELPPPELTLQHPEAARYHLDWGRPGDFGVVAEADGEVVGVAYGRLFTEADHGHGYVDEETPEIAIAVREGRRGAGIGAVLLGELAAAAREAGVARLSLSVDAENPARRLYERVGYRTISEDESGARMVLDLGDAV
jgi:GNAT superfamily N-acetyltransferase